MKFPLVLYMDTCKLVLSIVLFTSISSVDAQIPPPPPPVLEITEEPQAADTLEYLLDILVTERRVAEEGLRVIFTFQSIPAEGGQRSDAEQFELILHESQDPSELVEFIYGGLPEGWAARNGGFFESTGYERQVLARTHGEALLGVCEQLGHEMIWSPDLEAVAPQWTIYIGEMMVVPR